MVLHEREKEMVAAADCNNAGIGRHFNYSRAKFSIKPFHLCSFLKMKKDMVSVIIVNFNGKHLLKEAIDSVKKSIKRANINSEIIILDNCSTDESKEFVVNNYPQVIIVENKVNLNYSGINTALPYCNGEYILFLNNDISMDDDCIKNLIGEIKKDESVFQACPCLINYYDKKLRSAGTWVSRAFYSGHIKSSGKDGIKEIPYLGVGMVRREAVDYFGYLFDPDYVIYGEDLDLGLRIRLMGKKAVFVPDAIIYHMHSATMQEVSNAKKSFLLERNLIITFFKNMSAGNVLRFFPYLVLVRIFVISKDLALGKFSNSTGRLKAFWWIFSHFNLILKKRKHTQNLRKAKDSFILEVFSEKYIFSKKFVV